MVGRKCPAIYLYTSNLLNNKTDDKKKKSEGIGGNWGLEAKSLIKKSIEYDNPNNTAESEEFIEKFMKGHNVFEESKLVLWLSRIKIKNQLSGKEKISISFLSELHNNFDIALGLNTKLFKAKADFRYKRNKMYTSEYDLEVEF